MRASPDCAEDLTQQMKRQSRSRGWVSMPRQVDVLKRDDGELKNVRAGCFVRLWPRDA